MFDRGVLILSAAVAALVLPSAVRADGTAAFKDEMCSAADGPGTRLNTLNRTPNASNDDIVAAAQALVDAYRGCVDSFDRDSNGHQGDTSSDYVVTYRMYLQLQIARSLRRTASFAYQLHNSTKARTDYAGALEAIDKMEQIAGSAHVGPNDGSEGHLLKEGRALRIDIATDLAGLQSAAPSPAATAK